MTQAGTKSRSPTPAWLSASRLRPLAWAVLALAALTVLLVLVLGAELGSATVGLSLAGGALVLCLRSLHRMVQALSPSAIETSVTRDLEGANASRRALRDERRRVLKALNELAFDHAMGKLSDEDYRSVREGYELRAVEVMRALEDEPSLDPELARELERRGLGASPKSARGVVGEKDTGAREEASGGDAPADPVAQGCSECGHLNEAGTRVCTQCGKELAA